MAIPNIIECGICSLLPVNSNNVWFIEELFRYEDVKKYYVLRKDILLMQISKESH